MKLYFVQRDLVFSPSQIFNPKTRQWETLSYVSDYSPYVFDSWNEANKLALALGGFVGEVDKTDDLAFSRWVREYEGR